MEKVTLYLQIDHNNEIILTRDANIRRYSAEAVFSWDDASKLDFQIPANTEITFKFGNSMASWFFRDGPDHTEHGKPVGYPPNRGIFFRDGVAKGKPRTKKQGSFEFKSQSPKELVILFDDTDVKDPKGKIPDGYLKYEMYLVNKQINNKGEIAEVFYTIDPGGGKGSGTNPP